MKRCRNLILIAACAGFLHAQAGTRAGGLEVTRQGDSLRVAAPQLDFLAGKPLERLHNGASVTYVFSLSLADGHEGRPSEHRQERFILSYDLWEERFSIVQPESPGRSVSHLTQAQTQSWCLEQLSLPLPRLNPDTIFRVELLVRIPESRDERENPLTLASLIDLFSRKGSEAPFHWEAVSGSLRLADLKQKGPQRGLPAP